MHTLCLFASSRGHNFTCIFHTDLMQTITVEELLTSPGWNSDVTCYPLPRQMLIAVVVSCIRCQKPTNKTSTIAFYSCPRLVTNSVQSQLKWYHPSLSSGFFSPRLKVTNFMFLSSQGMSHLYHSSFQWRKFGDFVTLEMKELNRNVQDTVATATRVTISISLTSNNWWIESI